MTAHGMESDGRLTVLILVAGDSDLGNGQAGKILEVRLAVELVLLNGRGGLT
jgi:hypothetical protein